MDQQAVQWAQANQGDPRSHAILARDWADNNPQDPNAVKVYAKFGGAPPIQNARQVGINQAFPQDTPQPSAPEQDRGGALSRFLGMGKPATPQQGTTLPVPTDAASTPQGAETDPRDPNSMRQMTQNAPQALQANAGVASGAFSLPAQAAVGAATGALQPADTDKQRGIQTLLGAATPYVMSGVASGANSAANSMMKRAVGLTGATGKSFPEDIGNRMVSQGIYGTENQMSNQASKGLAQAEQRVNDIAKQSVATKGGNELGSQIEEGMNPHIDAATGQAAYGKDELAAAFQKAAQEARTKAPGYQPGTPEATRSMVDASGDSVPISTTPATPSVEGTYTAPSLLASKRGAEWNAYNANGMPGQTAQAAAQRGAANTFRGAFGDVTGGEGTRALTNEQTWLAAQMGLNKTPLTTKNPVDFTDLASAMVGGPGAYAAKKAVMTPLAQSLGAKAFQQGVAPAASTVGNATPTLLESLFGGSNASQR